MPSGLLCLLFLFITTSLSQSEFIEPTLLYQAQVVIEDTAITVNDQKIYVLARTQSQEPVAEEEIILIESQDSGNNWYSPVVLVNSTDGQMDNLIVVKLDNSTVYVYYFLYDASGEVFIGSLVFEPLENQWVKLPEISVAGILKNQNYKGIELLATDKVLSFVWYDTKQIQSATSVDQGETWVTSTLLKYPVIYDWRFSSVFTLEDGTLVLTAVGTQTSYPGTCNSIPAKLIVFRSQDYGKTWSSLNIASFASFPCCSDIKKINPVLTSNNVNEFDLLFFGNSSSEASCSILLTNSNNSGEAWSRPVSLFSDFPQSFIDPAFATYSLEEVQLYWIDVGGSLWRRFSGDGGNTWTLPNVVTEAILTESIELSSSHLALMVDDYDLAHLVFSISTQTNTSTVGTIYYVQQTSLRHWYLKPLALGLWITTAIITIILVAGWFIFAKWQQSPQSYDTY